MPSRMRSRRQRLRHSADRRRPSNCWSADAVVADSAGSSPRRIRSDSRPSSRCWRPRNRRIPHETRHLPRRTGTKQAEPGLHVKIIHQQNIIRERSRVVSAMVPLDNKTLRSSYRLPIYTNHSLYHDPGRPKASQWRSVVILVCRGTTPPAQCPACTVVPHGVSPRLASCCPSSVSEDVRPRGRVVCGVHCSQRCTVLPPVILFTCPYQRSCSAKHSGLHFFLISSFRNLSLLVIPFNHKCNIRSVKIF